MLRVMLPLVSASPTTAITLASLAIIHTVAAVYIVPVAAVYIAVAVEIIIIVDGDVVVAAPTAAISPTPAPRSSHGETNSKGNRHACCIVSGRGIVNGRIGVNCRAVDEGRIVSGNVNNFRVGLLDYDDLLRFNNFCFDFLLLAGFQVARTLSLLAHALDSFHCLVLLRQEGVP